MHEIGARIRMLREKLGITQYELAERIGYTSRTSIAKIEAGVVDLPQSKIEAIASALGVTPSILMGWVKSGDGGEMMMLSPEETELVTFYRTAEPVWREVAMDALRNHQIEDAARQA